MRLRDAREQRVPTHAAARHGTIGHGRHPVPAAGRDHLRLIDERMHLDLIADQRLVRKLHGLFDQRDGEVRYADVAGKSRALDLAEGAERVAQRDLRVGPMQQKQVDVREPQSLQTCLRRALEIAGGKVRRPYLRGDKDVLARDACGAQPLPHLAFVIVKLGGVDVPVAELQRLLDDARTGAPAQFPGAESDHRDARAVRFDDVGCDGHRHGLLTASRAAAAQCNGRRHERPASASAGRAGAAGCLPSLLMRRKSSIGSTED